MQNPYITASEAVKLIRKAGGKITVGSLIDDIARGHHEWGWVTKDSDGGPHARRTVRIDRQRFMRWLDAEAECY